MKALTEEVRFLAGVAAGAAGASLAWWVGPGLPGVVWLPTACATLLAGGSVWTATGHWARTGIDPQAGKLAAEGWRPPGRTASPRPATEWVARDPQGLESALEEPSAGLTFLEEGVGNLEGMGMPEELANLAVALAARSIPGLRENATRLMGALSARSAGSHGEDEASCAGDAKALARRLAETPGVARALGVALSRHGTRETVLLGLLAAARREGPLGTSAFRWLKDVDRRTWYALDNLGRPTLHPEGIAAMCHYLHELNAGKRLDTPFVEEAKTALWRQAALLRREAREDAAAAGALDQASVGAHA